MALQRVRDVVARIVPDSVETISYGMPAFKLRGRFLVSYAGWKQHCSVYTPTAPLPDDLLEDLVRARVADLDNGGR